VPETPVPDTVTECGEADAFETTDRIALRVPASDGQNVICSAHPAFGAMLHAVVRGGKIACRAIDAIVRVALPELVSTKAAGNGLPTTCGVEVEAGLRERDRGGGGRDAGADEASRVAPEHVRTTASSPLNVSAADGAKAMVKLQSWPGASVVGQASEVFAKELPGHGGSKSR
jgi:hypothetical protein